MRRAAGKIDGMGTDDDQGAANGMLAQIYQLETQALSDRQSIRDLEKQAAAGYSAFLKLDQQSEVDAKFIGSLHERAAVDLLVIERLQAEGVSNRATIDHLETALLASRRIGAAIGIVMRSRRVTEQQAFELLTITSQARNQKIRDVAEEVLLTGELP